MRSTRPEIRPCPHLWRSRAHVEKRTGAIFRTTNEVTTAVC